MSLALALCAGIYWASSRRAGQPIHHHLGDGTAHIRVPEKPGLPVLQPVATPVALDTVYERREEETQFEDNQYTGSPASGFHGYRDIPGAAELLEYARTRLDRKTYLELQGLVNTNTRVLIELEGQKDRIAREFALVKIDRGDFTYLPNDKRAPFTPHGAISITISNSAEIGSKHVIIHPGEYAELDVIAKKQDHLVALTIKQLNQIVNIKK